MAVLFKTHAAFSGTDSSRESINIASELEKPGVRMVAVELYASWCEECVQAGSIWKGLQKKYGPEGLRVFMVFVEGGKRCSESPGWTPEKILCDDDGSIVERFRVGSRLPITFLYSWDGRVAASTQDVKMVEKTINDYFKNIHYNLLVDRVRTERKCDESPRNDLIRDVVIREFKNQSKFNSITSSGVKIVSDEITPGACEDRLPVDGLLRIRLGGDCGSHSEISTILEKDGCFIASSRQSYNPGVKDGPDSPEAAAAKAVREVVGEIVRERFGPAYEKTMKREGAFYTDRLRSAFQFQSIPAGAEVMVDRKVVCKETPCSGFVPGGKHFVTMKLDKYLRKMDLVEIRNEQKISWSLEPDFGWIEVSSRPAGFDVELDGKYVGETPIAKMPVSVGRHEVHVWRECYPDQKESVIVERGREYYANFDPKPLKGRIEVKAVDERGREIPADVYIDENLIGKAPGEFDVSVCAKQIEVKDATRIFRDTIAVKDCGTLKISALLEDNCLQSPTGRGGPMCVIPAGEFWMGCNRMEDEDCRDNEKPYHKLMISGFMMDKFEVTAGEYRKCMEDGVCSQPAAIENCNYDDTSAVNHPINCVDWKQADAYCSWAGKRLPTEAEWEKAARGVKGGKYPWGNTESSDCDRAVMDYFGCGCGTGGTLPVGSKPGGISPFRVMDMAGNVWEWTSDWYDENYYKDTPVIDPRGPINGLFKVVRGGGWNSTNKKNALRTSFRNFYYLEDRFSDDLGFRCARSK